MIDTHAVRGGEIVQVSGGFPVIFYSPALRTGRFDNTSLMVDLASQGYVVRRCGPPLHLWCPCLPEQWSPGRP